MVRCRSLPVPSHLRRRVEQDPTEAPVMGLVDLHFQALPRRISWDPNNRLLLLLQGTDPTVALLTCPRDTLRVLETTVEVPPAEVLYRSNSPSQAPRSWRRRSSNRCTR